MERPARPGADRPISKTHGQIRPRRAHGRFRARSRHAQTGAHGRPTGVRSPWIPARMPPRAFADSPARAVMTATPRCRPHPLTAARTVVPKTPGPHVSAAAHGIPGRRGVEQPAPRVPRGSPAPRDHTDDSRGTKSGPGPAHRRARGPGARRLPVSLESRALAQVHRPGPSPLIPPLFEDRMQPTRTTSPIIASMHRRTWAEGAGTGTCSWPCCTTPPGTPPRPRPIPRATLPR